MNTMAPTKRKVPIKETTPLQWVSGPGDGVVRFFLSQKSGGNLEVDLPEPFATVGWNCSLVSLRGVFHLITSPLYGCFQKWLVPPNHPFSIGFSLIINHPFWGTPIFGNTSG